MSSTTIRWSGSVLGSAGFLCCTLLSLGSAACSLGGANRVAPKLYDFGAGTASAAPVPKIAIGSVTAAPTLEGTEIRYRHQADPYQARAYSESRWLAPPAELLADRLVSALAGPARPESQSLGPPATAPLRLSLELQSFEQVFEPGGGSRVFLRLVAEVHDARTRQLRGRRVLASDRAAPTADASGAVTALVQLADEAVAELLRWLAAEIERLPEPSESAEPDEPAAAAQPGDSVGRSSLRPLPAVS